MSIRNRMETSMGKLKQASDIPVVGGVSLTAPAWLPVLNEWIGFYVAVMGAIYITARVYFLIKNNGKEK